MVSKKLLVISRNAWANENSTGNMASNFFGDWDSAQVANLFCRDEIPNNTVCKKYYKISENSLIKSIFSNKPIGTSFYNDSIAQATKATNIQIREKKIYDWFRKKRFYIFLWLREIIWKCGNWKNSNLNAFLDDFKPDIIYMPIYDSFYMHDVLLYVKLRTNAKIILFTGDNNYTLHQQSFSPFYWLNIFLLRRKIRKSIQLSDLRFCGNENLCNQYINIFNKPFQTLYKGGISNQTSYSHTICQPIKIVFTGNIVYGRWKTLEIIGQVLDAINQSEIKAVLYLYTMSPMSEHMKKALLTKKSINFKGGVSAGDLPKIQSDADILLHVESFEKKEKKRVKYSFSTKIVDYLSCGRCVFAVGDESLASIDYLIKNDAAIVAVKKDDIAEKLEKLVAQPKLIGLYAEKASLCAKTNHDLYRIRNNIRIALGGLFGESEE